MNSRSLRLGAGAWRHGIKRARTRRAATWCHATGRAVCVLAFAGILYVAPSALADADGPDYFRVAGVKPGSVVNVRRDPAPSAPKVGELPHDADGIMNLGCKGGLSFAEWEKATPARRAAARFERWCRISYRGLTGWVAGWLLAEGNAPPRSDGGRESVDQ